MATDIDPQMIQFARNNYSSNTIEYMTQDISQSWDELSSTFKELEAKKLTQFFIQINQNIFSPVYSFFQNQSN